MRSPRLLRERTSATHILSALSLNLEKQFKTPDHKFIHKKFDLLDFDDEDILTHIPEAVRFIEEAFYPVDDQAAPSDPDELADRVGIDHLNEDKDATSRKQSSPRGTKDPVNSVFVHCAMGKSRSVTLVVAWLLYKYPQRWRLSATRPSQVQSEATSRAASPPAPSSSSSSAAAAAASGNKVDGRPGVLCSRPLSSPKEAVDRAINWVRDSRSIAEPNEGFHEQLQLWWQMGCPTKQGEMDAHPTYARWLYKREVEAAVSIGVAPAPDKIRFEDEASTATSSSDKDVITKEYRCSKCRGLVCDSRFVQEHVPLKEGVEKCDQIYVSPLGWMRGTIDVEELEGRLICPGKRCGNQIGRYNWKGFRCGCGRWITPVICLQRAKVDEVDLRNVPGLMNIRMGPGLQVPIGGKKVQENL